MLHITSAHPSPSLPPFTTNSIFLYHLSILYPSGPPLSIGYNYTRPTHI